MSITWTLFNSGYLVHKLALNNLEASGESSDRILDLFVFIGTG